MRTDLSGMTEEQKIEHRKQKNREKSQKWRAKNPEKHRAQVKAWQEANPEKLHAYQKRRNWFNDVNREKRRQQWREWAAKNRHLRPEIEKRRYERTYGITHEQRDALIAGQNSLCKICKTSELGKQGWQTDHCHKTGKIRGMLCSNCNTLLGLSKDNPDILQAAAKYLVENSV